MPESDESSLFWDFLRASEGSNGETKKVPREDESLVEELSGAHPKDDMAQYESGLALGRQI